MANPIYQALPTTIFTVMSGLAREMAAINLGQGFPDEPGPRVIREKASQALLDGDNQYPPMPGLPELRQAVADHYRRTQGLDLDWASEVTITSGATEAITACLMGLLDPGDEVVLIEPLYDTYLPVVRLLGAVPKLVRLTPPRWELPRAELAAAFGPRTKAILLNTPIVSDKLLKGEFHDLKEIMGKSREQGMRTFDYSLFELYDNGVIDYEEAIRNADSANELRLNIKLNSKRTPPSNTGIYHQLS